MFHAALNAGKTVRRIDLKSADGEAEFLRLTDAADVLIEGFRPGVMARLGLDYAYAADAQSGADLLLAQRLRRGRVRSRRRPGMTATIWRSGVLHRNGVPPRFFDPPVADVTGSLFAAIAILGALQGTTAGRAGLPHRSRHRRRGDAVAAVRDRRVRRDRHTCRSRKPPI